MGQVRIRISAACLLAALPMDGESLRGRILADDGMPLPEDAVVVLSCGQSDRKTVGVDDAGWFEFEEPPKRSDCLVETSAPGYRPHSIATGALPSDPGIAAVVLHRLGKGQGESLSVAHLAAPPHAVASFHAAVREMRRGHDDGLEAALRLLEAAVSAYPGYAQAWFEIGRIHLAQGSAPEAIRAFGAATRADPWFVSPYEPLILLLEAAGDTRGASSACQALRKINPALPEDCRTN